MKKVLSIVFFVGLIASVIFDIVYDKSLSSYVFLIGCFIITIYTFVKLPKNGNKKTIILMAISSLLINAYAVLEICLPEFFSNYSASGFRILIYSVFLLTTLQISNTKDNSVS